jgi:hypothetical protein
MEVLVRCGAVRYGTMRYTGARSSHACAFSASLPEIEVPHCSPAETLQRSAESINSSELLLPYLDR